MSEKEDNQEEIAEDRFDDLYGDDGTLAFKANTDEENLPDGSFHG